jgi:hypothetical protein
MNGKYRTEQQLAALREAYKLLEGQFDDLLIVCAMRSDHESHGTDPDVYWKGGFLMARSLAEHAKERIQYTRRVVNKPLPDPRAQAPDAEKK